MKRLLALLATILLLTSIHLYADEKTPIKLYTIDDNQRDEIFNLLVNIITALSISKDFIVVESESETLLEYEVVYNESDRDIILGKANLTAASLQKLFNEISILISKREAIKEKKDFDIKRRKLILVSFCELTHLEMHNHKKNYISKNVGLKPLTINEGEEIVINILKDTFGFIYGEKNYEFEFTKTDSASEFAILPDYSKNIIDEASFNNLERAIKILVSALSYSIQMQDSIIKGVPFDVENIKSWSLRIY